MTYFPPARMMATHAADCCTSVKAAMTLFSDELGQLQAERSRRREEAVRYSGKFVSDDELEDYEQEGRLLQGRNDALVAKYEAAIDSCNDQLCTIGNDGLPMAAAGAWTGVASDTILSALAATSESRRVDVLRVIRRVVVRLMGTEFRMPYWVSYAKYRFWDWKSWLVRPASGSFLLRFRANLASVFLGPARGLYGPGTVIRQPQITGRWGIGREYFRQTRPATTAIGRIGGRAFFVLGIGLTYQSEYQQADQRYREQEPGLTDKERHYKAVEAAAVRTGAQVAASVGLGAAIGSVVPVAGTAVGIVIGLVVGITMCIDHDGDGRALGDDVADAGEAVWNFGKRVLGSD